MKALTIRQPWASLVAHGVKTIETRSWSTKYRGRIAIHAGAKTPVEGEEYGTGWWWCQHMDLGGEIVEQATVRSYPAPLGAVVASASLVDVVPIIGTQEDRPPATFVAEYEDETGGLDLPHHRGGLWLIGHNELTQGKPTRIEDQRPYGVWTPGRWAWLLDDVKPTTARCAGCWGEGNGDQFARPAGAGMVLTSCPTCAGHGYCPPVPAKGKQGLWRWEP